MRYLVTGGAGFLGTNLCLSLAGEGAEVIVMDDMSTAYPGNAKLLESKGIEIIRHDITEPLPESGRFDFIYNLACPASPAKYQSDPIKTFRTSVWGVWNMLEYSRKGKTPMLHASTSEIYGDPLEHPQNEKYHGNVNPIGPRACYDEGKRAAETLITEFRRKYLTQVKIVRIFNTYGPLMDPGDGRVVSNFIVSALKGLPLRIHGSGRQTRSFCYVTDLIDGLRKVEMAPDSFSGPINLGNDNEHTIEELANALEQVIGKHLELESTEMPQDDPAQRKPDLSLARTELGWEPKTTLDVGLRNTVQYFRSLGIGSESA